MSQLELYIRQVNDLKLGRNLVWQGKGVAADSVLGKKMSDKAGAMVAISKVTESYNFKVNLFALMTSPDQDAAVIKILEGAANVEDDHPMDKLE